MVLMLKMKVERVDSIRTYIQNSAARKAKDPSGWVLELRVPLVMFASTESQL